MPSDLQISFSTIDRFFKKAQSRSLWTYSIHGGCCADEVLNAMGCRYDMERFGCVSQMDPQHADLLWVSGSVSEKTAPFLKALYDQMRLPRYVIAVGACAMTGGLFSTDLGGNWLSGIEKVIPVDVFIPGCPPRPEAILNGILALQEKIVRGSDT